MDRIILKWLPIILTFWYSCLCADCTLDLVTWFWKREYSQSNGLSLTLLGYKKTLPSCSPFLTLSLILMEASCQAVTCLTERGPCELTMVSSQQSPRNWVTRPNNPWMSCQQPHKWTWKQISPQLNLDMTTAPAHTLTAAWEKTLSQQTHARFLAHRDCEINHCCFKPLIWGMICYIAIDN